MCVCVCVCVCLDRDIDIRTHLHSDTQIYIYKGYSMNKEIFAAILYYTHAHADPETSLYLQSVYSTAPADWALKALC